MAGWKICLKFSHLDCNAIFIIEESWNLTCMATTPFFSSTLVSFWSLKIHIRLTQRLTQLTAWWRVYLEPWFLLPCWFEENINLRRKGRTDKEKKENIWPTEEKKNRKEKNKYLDKENIWSMEEKKTREGIRGIIWRRKLNGDTNQPTDQSGEYKAICLFES